MKFIYSLINMLAEMAPYLLFGFMVAGVLYAFVPGKFYRNHLSCLGIWSVIKAALIIDRSAVAFVFLWRSAYGCIFAS